MFEQALILQSGDERRSVRRSTVELDRPTESGDTELHILTNLLREQAEACAMARVYRTRWTIEGAFQTLTDVLRCEVEIPGDPNAALFSFAVAVLAWNLYAVVTGALRATHGRETLDKRLSDHHLVQDVILTLTGWEIVVDAIVLERHQQSSAADFAGDLLRLAPRVNLSRYPKTKRCPKKPPPRKRSGARHHHISTAKLLAKARAK